MQYYLEDFKNKVLQSYNRNLKQLKTNYQTVCNLLALRNQLDSNNLSALKNPLQEIITIIMSDKKLIDHTLKVQERINVILDRPLTTSSTDKHLMNNM